MEKDSILPSDKEVNYQNMSLSNRTSKSKELWLLDNHPAFTGICGNCGYNYGNYKVLDIDEKSSHWNCPECEMSYK